MNQTYIELAHGNGGIRTHQLIKEICIKHFDNPELSRLGDGAILQLPEGKTVFTTDSYVIRPIFFPGGDIGSLAVSGTVNDLAVMGGIPYAISIGFIIEEGFLIEDLDTIARSISESASNAGVSIVTGDTKVVEKGSADGIFINSSGIGIIPTDQSFQNSGQIQDGDAVIVSGNIGDHAAAIMTARKDFPLKATINSDAAPLGKLIQEVLRVSGKNDVRIMRDPTRGGLATTLNELTHGSGCSCVIEEASLPVAPEVTGICELTGFDPLYLANEGKVIFICEREYAEKILKTVKQNEYGKNAAIIGHMEQDSSERVYIKTRIGGTRICDMLVSDMLPRIC